ncbi:MAG: hypothetical protein GEEBNDBF_02108 [bacterium]|nr:hypothetical protein [bacterium]
MPSHFASRPFPLTDWALPLIMATSLALIALPGQAQADDFATSLRGFGGYAMLRQGDLHGASDFFRTAYAKQNHDPLILQGLGEVAIYEHDATTLAACRGLLLQVGATDRLAWLDARLAHARGEWGNALAQYSVFLTRQEWAGMALESIQAIHFEVGDRPFRALLSGLASTDAAAADRLAQLNPRWVASSYADEATDSAPQPWQAEAYVAANDLPTIEQAVREFWRTRQDAAARALLASAAERYPRHTQVQALLKEQLLVESNLQPVPPAKRTLPAGSLASTWSGESGWEFAGMMPRDLALAGPLATYWGQLSAIFNVSEGYYLGLLREFQQLKTDIDSNVQSRSAGGLMENLAHFNMLVQGAITMSEREITSTGQLPIPYGFEAFAAKLREYQDLRTSAFADLQSLVRTQRTDYADSAKAKAEGLVPLAEEAVRLFLQAYDRSPQEWKVEPKPESAEGGLVGEAADEPMSDGRRLYGPEFDFDIPEDGDTIPIGEG